MQYFCERTQMFCERMQSFLKEQKQKSIEIEFFLQSHIFFCIIPDPISLLFTQ